MGSYLNLPSGGYELSNSDFTEIKNLGFGGYGDVKLALHEPSNTKMAIKECSLFSHNKDLQEREELLVKAINFEHEHIIKYFGTTRNEEFIFIFMEAMDLSFQVIKTKFGLRVPPKILSCISYAVGSVILYLKSKNIIHRDIKPDNILVNYAGEIKVADFGICGFLEDSNAVTGVGTMLYMAPERFDLSANEGPIYYNVKADIWALGVSLVEMANCSHPFHMFSSIVEYNLYFFLHHNYSDLLRVCQDEEGLQDFVDMCTKCDADSRIDLNDLMNQHFVISSGDYEARKEKVSLWINSLSI